MKAKLTKQQRKALYESAKGKGWKPSQIAKEAKTNYSTMISVIARDSQDSEIVADLDEWLLTYAEMSPVERNARAREEGAKYPIAGFAPHERRSSLDNLVGVIEGILPAVKDGRTSAKERLDLMEVNLKATLALVPSVRRALSQVSENPDD